MKTIKDVFTQFREGLPELYDKHETDALSLLATGEITGFSNAKLKAFPELELSQIQIGQLTNILTELKTGKPIQYILGKTEFYGLPFFVNPSVLIPRPETEELVEWALEEVGSRKSEAGSVKSVARRILDIGTGSGCIAIALRKHLPFFDVSAIDISVDALQIARKNAQLNEVNINFVEADILNLNPDQSIYKQKYEIIISNPPYVTLYDKTQMHTNVTDFEPHTALFVPLEDPLIFYKAIADFASVHLVSGGLLFFEINESYGENIVNMLKDKGFSDIELRKDMSGRDRMVNCLNRGF